MYGDDFDELSECPRCGSEWPEGASQCPTCGADQEQFLSEMPREDSPWPKEASPELSGEA